MNSDLTKKLKRPKPNIVTTTNPGSSRPRIRRSGSVKRNKPEPLCPLLAKDSEWVDILQNTSSSKTPSIVSGEEEVLQLVECEDGPQMKPLAIMFPGLLDKDPQALHGMLNRAMSTTEVTRRLVDLGQKANFTFMKKADRLIPPDKQWMESLTENSNSISSVNSPSGSNCISSDYEADSEITDYSEEKKMKKRRKHFASTDHFVRDSSSQIFKEKP